MLHLQKTEVNEAKLHYTVFVLFSIEYTLERISRLSHSVFNVLHTHHLPFDLVIITKPHTLTLSAQTHFQRRSFDMRVLAVQL